MTSLLGLSFKDGVSVSGDSKNDFSLHSPTLNLELRGVSEGLRDALAILSNGGATERELNEVIVETDGSYNLPQFYYYLERFISLGLICHTLKADDTVLASLIPFSVPYKPTLTGVKVDDKYVLSRFAYCHREGSQIIWQSPLSQAKVILTDWRGAAILTELAQAQDCFSLTKISGVSLELTQTFLNLFCSAKLLSMVDEEGRVVEAENEVLAQWEFHDLLFHSLSRKGRQTNAVGKSFRFLGKIKPLPAIKATVAQEVIRLYKPDLQQLEQVDPSFTSVLEQRKSIRSYGEGSISARQLGEFLYRCARVRKIVPREYIECSDRPYPSGGASYELELYLAINICEDINPGIYHYCPQNHLLEKKSPKNDYLEALLINAQKANGEDCLPQVLIIITARFARVSWAYESIAYSLILKHVGVLYQTMYLVATAMNLAPCALGTGNPDLFAAATGIDYYAESSVGEFILGRTFS